MCGECDSCPGKKVLLAFMMVRGASVEWSTVAGAVEDEDGLSVESVDCA